MLHHQVSETFTADLLYKSANTSILHLIMPVHLNAAFNRKFIKNYASGKFRNFFTFSHWVFEESQNLKRNRIVSAATSPVFSRLTPFNHVFI